MSIGGPAVYQPAISGPGRLTDGVVRGGAASGLVHTGGRSARHATGGRCLTEQAPGVAEPALGRARAQITRAIDVRFGTVQSILAGLFLGWLAIATKAAFRRS